MPLLPKRRATPATPKTPINSFTGRPVGAPEFDQEVDDLTAAGQRALTTLQTPEQRRAAMPKVKPLTPEEKADAYMANYNPTFGA